MFIGAYEFIDDYQAPESLGCKVPIHKHGSLSMALAARIWTVIGWPRSNFLDCPSICRFIDSVTLACKIK